MFSVFVILWKCGGSYSCRKKMSLSLYAPVCCFFVVHIVFYPFFFVFKHVTSLSPFLQPTGFAQKLLSLKRSGEEEKKSIILDSGGGCHTSGTVLENNPYVHIQQFID